MTQRDETNYLNGKWRCSECGSLNSLELDNVCWKCFEKALREDKKKLSALTSGNRE